MRLRWRKGDREPAERSSSEEIVARLEERLRHLDWPKPAQGAKERMLEDLLSARERGGSPSG